MAILVVDASVLIEYLVTSDYTAQAQAFFEQRNDEDIVLIPEFCLLECTNVIWKQVRFAGVSHEAAEAILDGLQMLGLILTQMAPLLKRSLQIAVNNTLAVYNSAYIALAE